MLRLGRLPTDIGHISIDSVFQDIDDRFSFDREYALHIASQSVQRLDGRQTGLVAAVGMRDGAVITPLFAMRSSIKFNANLLDDTPLPAAPIQVLNGGIASRDGFVKLAPSSWFHDGLAVKNLKLIEAPFTYEFSEIDNYIVDRALRFLELHSFCNREIDPSLLPGVKWLDYSRVAQVKLAGKKQAVLSHIEKTIEEMLISKGFTDKMRADYKTWLAGRSLRARVITTLRRAGLQDV